MATTFTEPGLFLSKAACTTGTELAPTLATEGLSLIQQGGVKSLSVVVEANDAVTNLASGSRLMCFIYNTQTSAWARGNIALDLILVGGSIKEAFPAISVQSYGRIAYVPDNLGTAVDVYINGGGESFAGTERTSIAVTQGIASTLNAQVVGNIAHDSADSGNPVKVGGKAFDPAAMPGDVTASDRVDSAHDLKGRQIVYLGTQLDATNDTVSQKPTTHSNINTSALAASLLIKSSAGRCYEIRGYNNKATPQFIQVHDAASLPADASVPEEVFTVPATANFTIEFPRGKSFTVGMVVCNSSTAATKTIGSADCWFSCDFE